MTDERLCTRCGSPLAPGALFCSRCGFDVSGERGSVATVKMAAPDDAPDAQAELLEELRRATIGEFDIAAELGRGGMATVFLAHEIALDRKVAIKVMTPGLLAGGRGMADRFKREARTAAALSHPHIIPIYGVRESGRLLFFVMKFVQGRSLDAIVKEHGALPIRMVQAILAQAGSALDYAHRHGVIHRDIKPANIMLDVEGWAVVTDFGIAKVSDAQGLTMTGATIGTPTYMSPEQCAAKEITGATDQYSLGVAAYEMLTGRVPFDAESVMSLMWLHFHEPPPPIRERRPDCPPELARAIERMLAKAPADRWGTLEEAVEAIGSPPLNDPIRQQMKALARGAAGPAVTQPHTPASPVPRPSTPRSATPPGRVETNAPTTPLPPPAPARTPAAPTTPLPHAPTPSRGSRMKWVGAATALVIALGVGVLILGRRNPAPAPPRPDSVAAPAAPAPVATVSVTPSPASIAVGATAQLTALLKDASGNPLAGRPITWTSSDSTMLRVSATGLVTGLAPGYINVEATSESRAGIGTVIVTETAVAVASVAVAPAELSLPLGDSAVLTAAPRDTRGNTLAGHAVTWTSSDRSVATVSPGGTISALHMGSTLVTAVVEGKRGTARVSVTPAAVAAVAVSPPTVTLQAGERAQLSATARDGHGNALAGRRVSWTSSDRGVATVSSDGTVVGVRTGQATIIVQIESKTAAVSVTVTAVPVATLTVAPASLTIPVGKSAQFSATPRDARGGALPDRDVHWSSSNPAVATVSGTGTVVGIAEGTTTIVATSESATGNASVTVPAAPKVVVSESAAVQPPGPPGTGEAAAGALPRRGIALGGSHSCGITETGGAVCWGNNASGQLGEPTAGAQVSNPTPAGAPATYTAIVAGGDHTCALTSSGTAICWGSNTRGQLGAGRSAGAPALTPVAGGRIFRALTAGARHTCGLAADGAAWCWGDNSSGQVGDGSTRAATAPRAVTGGVKFKQLAAGSDHTCGLTDAGKVFCWGDGFSGQLGRGTRETQAEPVAVDAPGPFTDLAAGGKHTCTLTQSGKAFCWGANVAGEIGDGSRDERDRPVAVSGARTYIDLSAGSEHTCALTDGGEAYCWGRDRDGQLGDGGRADRAAPVKVATDDALRSISAGTAHTCALTRNQEVVCWGNNGRGQLGDGTLTGRATPAPVTAGARQRP